MLTMQAIPCATIGMSLSFFNNRKRVEKLFLLVPVCSKKIYKVLNEHKEIFMS